MAECDQGNTIKTHEKGEAAAVETQDRGLFNFMGKKEEEKKPQEAAAISHEFEHKVHVTEPVHKEEIDKDHKLQEEKSHQGLLQKKLARSDSSSSSSDEEDVEGGGEKKKKKLKDKFKVKITGEHKEEKKHEDDTSVPVEKIDEPEEKKGFLDKIKNKLPGGHKKTGEVPPPLPVAESAAAIPEVDAKEKKGILEKIKEKLPGYHAKPDEEKEKEEKEGAH